MGFQWIFHVFSGGVCCRPLNILNSHSLTRKRPPYLSRDLFHQPFQGTIFLMVFDFKGVFLLLGCCVFSSRGDFT